MDDRHFGYITKLTKEKHCYQPLLAIYSQKAKEILKTKKVLKSSALFRFSIARIPPNFKKNHQISFYTWFK